MKKIFVVLIIALTFFNCERKESPTNYKAEFEELIGGEKIDMINTYKDEDKVVYSLKFMNEGLIYTIKNTPNTTQTYFIPYVTIEIARLEQKGKTTTFLIRMFD